MAIEFPTGPVSGTMTVSVPDNWPAAPAGPADILVTSVPFNVNVAWQIPSPHNMALGGSFQIRAYVESIGPGQEMQLGPTQNVPVVPGLINYTHSFTVPANTLLGEGQPFGGAPVSGVYKIVCVLQHLNPGPTWISGYAEENLRMFLQP
jgi:hypothetical protein